MRLTAAETIKMWVDVHKINYVHKDCDLNFYCISFFVNNRYCLQHISVPYLKNIM